LRDELGLVIDLPAHVDAIEKRAGDLGFQNAVIEIHHDLGDHCKAAVFVKQSRHKHSHSMEILVSLAQSNIRIARRKLLSH
jgi:hypothetical protein